MFYGNDPDGKGYSTRAHLAEVIGMLGPPPPELLERGERSAEFFDEHGMHLSLCQIPTSVSYTTFSQFTCSLFPHSLISKSLTMNINHLHACRQMESRSRDTLKHKSGKIRRVSGRNQQTDVYAFRKRNASMATRG